MDCSPPSSFCPWDSPGKNTGVGCHFLPQGSFPTQGWNEHPVSPALAGGFFTTITTCDALAPMAVTQTKRLTLAWGDPRPYRTGTNPHILGVRPQMAPVYRGWVIMPTSLGIKEGMPGTHTCTCQVREGWDNPCEKTPPEENEALPLKSMISSSVWTL